MTTEEKISRIRTLLGEDAPDDIALNAYLLSSRDEILAWNNSEEEDVPRRYENIQIFSVIVGINTSGAEGQVMHTENSIARTFSYADMVDYIHKHVNPGVRMSK